MPRSNSTIAHCSKGLLKGTQQKAHGCPSVCPKEDKMFSAGPNNFSKCHIYNTTCLQKQCQDQTLPLHTALGAYLKATFDSGLFGTPLFYTQRPSILLLLVVGKSFIFQNCLPNSWLMWIPSLETYVVGLCGFLHLHHSLLKP